jgi:hypothetical protein
MELHILNISYRIYLKQNGTAPFPAALDGHVRSAAHVQNKRGVAAAADTPRELQLLRTRVNAQLFWTRHNKPTKQELKRCVNARHAAQTHRVNGTEHLDKVLRKGQQRGKNDVR